MGSIRLHETQRRSIDKIPLPSSNALKKRMSSRDRIESDEQNVDEEDGRENLGAKKTSKVPPRAARKRSKKAPQFACTEKLLDAIEKGNGSVPIPKLKECRAAAHMPGRGKALPKGPSLPRTTIARIMRDAAMNYSEVMRMERKALDLAQDVLERNLVERFNEVREIAEHRKRVTVKHDDFRYWNQRNKFHQ
jgi:histone H3/H4